MKRYALASLLAIVVLLATAKTAFTAEETESPTDGTPAHDSYALCLPGVYLSPANGCSPLGPSQYLSRMAEMGITFPIPPLQADAPDPALRAVPYTYARVTTPDAPVFATLEDAIAGEPVKRYIREGFDFISYIDVKVVDGKKYYMIDLGEWMRRSDLSGDVAVSVFQGLVFHKTPELAFGWVLFPVETKLTPGYQVQDYTGHKLVRYDVVLIYAVQQVGDVEWYLVGPDEWVEQRFIARVVPSPTPPEGVDNGRWIEINLYEQTLAAYDNAQLVYATLVSSGTAGFWTRPGLFQIYEKMEVTHMRGHFEPDYSDYYYLEDVPWTMYFDEKRALHGTYWHNGFGYPRSHGCVNLSNGDARWVFDWAKEGDWVYVWDPSGQTPVDPDLYTEGGA